MTLKEYKNFIEASESDKEYICNWCNKILYTEKQANDFAIGFAEWAIAKNMGVNKFTLYKGELEIYKKEKGL
jgi:hypothetical protein